MRYFSQLLRKIDETTSIDEKVVALQRYFSMPIDEKDKLWTITLLSRKLPSRIVNTSELRSWMLEATKLPDWLVEETNNNIGDLTETLSLMWPSIHHSPSDASLTAVIDDIRLLKNEPLALRKEKVLSYWNRLDQEERFWFNRLISGGFRVSVSTNLLTQALAVSVGVNSKIIAHRLMSQWTADNASWQKLFIEFDQEDEVSKPYPFLLANNFNPDAILDTPADWSIEYKWDGIRAQIIKRGERMFVWSLGEELLTDKFPEFQSLNKACDEDFVFDGEILAFEGYPLNFQLLQSRIGKKNITKKIQSSCPITYFASDILELNGQDLRQKTYQERRAILGEIMSKINMSIVASMPKSFSFDSWKDIVKMRSEALTFNAEGILLKKWDSSYDSEQNSGFWYKWKLDPHTIDAVLIYAQQGSGRRANPFSDFTFAVWHTDEDGQRKLIPFAKAYTGLSEDEYEQITSFVKKNTIEKFGPVYSVKPQLVFEISFESVAFSKRHKSGILLKLPSIKVWRQDKSIDDADELSTLVKMVK